MIQPSCNNWSHRLRRFFFLPGPANSWIFLVNFGFNSVFCAKAELWTQTLKFTESAGIRQYWNTATGRSPCATKNDEIDPQNSRKNTQDSRKNHQTPAKTKRTEMRFQQHCDYDLQTPRNSQKCWNPLCRLKNQLCMKIHGEGISRCFFFCFGFGTTTGPACTLILIFWS